MANFVISEYKLLYKTSHSFATKGTQNKLPPDSKKIQCTLQCTLQLAKTKFVGRFLCSWKWNKSGDVLFLEPKLDLHRARGSRIRCTIFKSIFALISESQSASQILMVLTAVSFLWRQRWSVTSKFKGPHFPHWTGCAPSGGGGHSSGLHKSEIRHSISSHIKMTATIKF